MTGNLNSPLTAPFGTLAAARSFLFVPATRPERFAKALESGADAIIIDLEDAVAPRDKNSARDRLADAFEQFTLTDLDRLVVRMNASATPWMDADLKFLRELVTQGLRAVMLPKADSAVVLQHLALSLGRTLTP